MPYPYDADDLAALNRLATFYNGAAVSGGNPGGMAAGGHRTNFIPSLQDEARVGSATSSAATSASTSAGAASTSATAAAASSSALTGTSTDSVTIGQGTKSFTTQLNKTFDVGTFVEVVSAASPTTHYMLGQVTSYSPATGALSISVGAGGFSGSGARADWSIYGRAGPQGIQGVMGNTGAQGATPALQWTFDSSVVDSDPGSGTMRINNANYASANYLLMDNLDRNGATQTAFLDSLDDSSNAANRGTIVLMQTDTPTTYAVFAMTLSPGTVEDASGYRRVPIAFVGGSGVFTSGSAVAFAFFRSGNKGLDGTGVGDTISDISSSTAGRFATYSDTSGKHITQAAVGLGTSGAAVGRLDTANTWGGAQTFAAKVDAQQDFYFSGDITPAQITSNQDNYAPTGIGTASVLRLSSDASRNLTGITTGADGRFLLLVNVGSNDIVLVNDATSIAANRFLFKADYTLAPGQGSSLIYDATQSRWIPAGSPAGLVGVGSAARPSYSFSADPNTGMFNDSADQLGWSTGGTERLVLGAIALAPKTNDGIALGSGALNWSDLFLASGGVINWNNGAYTLTHGSGALTTSGQFLVSTFANFSPSGGLSPAANAQSLFSSNAGSFAIAIQSAGTSGVVGAMSFYDGSNQNCGSITLDTTANTTAFNTSSDARCKPNRELLRNAGAVIDWLKVYDHDKDGNDIRGVGLVAQEVHKVIPRMVYEGDGNLDLKIGDEGFAMWGIDNSKAVPYLIAALQEANATIRDLQARVAALEAAP